jgi:hypothetical protein
MDARVGETESYGYIVDHIFKVGHESFLGHQIDAELVLGGLIEWIAYDGIADNQAHRNDG